MYLTLQRKLPAGRSSASVCLTLSGLLLSEGPAAHHGTGASYDRNSPVEMSGVVREFVWRNPHSRLFFDATDAEGNTVTWGAEMTSPMRLSRLGWTRTTLQPGDAISLTIFPSRAGAAVGEVDRAAPLIINGEPAPRESAQSAETPREEPTRDLPYAPRDFSGIWRPAGGPRRSVIGEVPPPMTPAGRARFEAQLPSYGPRSVPPALGNDPVAGCNPLGVTRSLLFIRPFEIVQSANRIMQLFEWTRFWRDIWMDGRAMPADLDPLWLGYSIGHWEENTLVVETAHFDARTWLDQLGYPHSEAMRLVERWQRVDHDTLVLDMTIHDPAIYLSPIEVGTKTYALQPDAEFREEFCAPVDEDSFNQRIRDPAGGVGAGD